MSEIETLIEMYETSTDAEIYNYCIHDWTPAGF